MADLATIQNTDKFDVIQSELNAAITKLNDLKRNLESLTAGQVIQQVDTTDFNFQGIMVPNLKAGQAPREKLRISIGDWNMHASSGGSETVNVAHNLSSLQYKTIAIINVIVRDDFDASYYPLNSQAELAGTNFSGLTSGGVKFIDATNIGLVMRKLDKFDNTSCDSTGYNRGFIDIEYTP